MAELRRQRAADSSEISDRLREIQQRENRLPPAGSREIGIQASPDFPKFYRLHDAPNGVKGVLMYRRDTPAGGRWNFADDFSRCKICPTPEKKDGCCVPNPSMAWWAKNP